MVETPKSRKMDRASTRYDIHCPVTVQVPGRLNGTTQVDGELWEISEDGARIFLDKPLRRGTEILLFAHFRHPHKGVSTIRFQGVVESLNEQPRFEMAVRFNGSAKFVPGKFPKPPEDSPEGQKSPGS